MNQLRTPAPATISVVDQPAWSDFDLLDLHTLSSPPSWVSGSEPTDPNHIIPALEVEQTIATSRDLSSTSFDDYDSACHQSNIAEQGSSQGSPYPSSLQSNTSRARFDLLTAYLKPNIPVADIHHAVPDSDAIVDSALGLSIPLSPVLSELPLPPFDCSAFSESLPASVSAKPFTPFFSHPVVGQNALSERSSQEASLDSILTLQPSSAEDACSSHASVSSPQDFRSLAPAKKAIALNVRLVRNGVTGRVQKQTRRYSAPKSSRYCHLCARHQRCVKMIPCGNVEVGLCQKSVCKKCIDTYKLEVSGPSWACPHCQNKCPQRAKCFAYDRQTARRREKTLKAKMILTAGVAPTVKKEPVIKQ